MSNILEAIFSISTFPEIEVNNLSFGRNRINNVGDGLEEFIKNAFSDNLSNRDPLVTIQKHKVFSYGGSATRPPDLMLCGGDAIEVKKTESLKADLQLNSSHPKAKLHITSPLINHHCRTCETWEEKDIIYAVGHVLKGSNTLSSLWLIYGTIYAADDEVYTGLKDTIIKSLADTPEVDFGITNELGRINYVDPLEITNMRIRGMWLLQPPVKVFDYVYKYDLDLKFQMIAIVPTEKYMSFPEASREKIENNNDDRLEIVDIEVKNPNNIVALIPCKLITLKILKD